MSATAMIYFDTLQYAKTLKAAGFSPVQAETLAEAQQETLSGCLTGAFATKSDITDLKTELKSDIGDLRTEFKSDVAELRSEMVIFKSEITADIKVLTSRVNRLDWMLGLLLTGMASLVVKAFFI